METKYRDSSRDGKYEQVDRKNYKDDFVKKNKIYMVTYVPTGTMYKKVVAGLYISDNKYYAFEIGLGENEYSGTCYQQLLEY